VAGSDACSRRLAAATPEYGALAAVVAPGVQPAWLADPALGARAQFLCSVLATCAQRLPQVRGHAVGRVGDLISTGRHFGS